MNLQFVSFRAGSAGLLTLCGSEWRSQAVTLESANLGVRDMWHPYMFHPSLLLMRLLMILPLTAGIPSHMQGVAMSPDSNM